MLARVLFVLLVGVPMCRGAKGTTGAAYPAYYEADGEVQNADFYDSYNDEIRSPQKFTTVMEAFTHFKRRDLEDVRTLNPKEIIDVKGTIPPQVTTGVLNNILQGKKPEFLRGRRTARSNTDSYDYLENSINVQPEVKAEKGLVPMKWQPTDEVRQGSPTVEDEEYFDDSSSQATEQHLSFVYQPETSTYGKDDIVAEVKMMIPVSDGKVPIDYRKPTQEVQTWGTTEETEETEDTLMYPLESTTYSNSDMQAEVRKLVQHWSSSSSVKQETSSYNEAAMRADVRQLVQHWSPRGKAQQQSHVSNVLHRGSSVAKGEQETSSYNEAAMRADVRQLVQHWSPRGKAQQQSHVSNILHRGSSVAKGEMNQQSTGIQTEVKKLDAWNPVLDYKQWSAPDNAQHWSGYGNVKTQKPSLNVQHWNPLMNVQQWNPMAADNLENLPFTTSKTDLPITDETESDTVGVNPRMRQNSFSNETTVLPLSGPEFSNESLESTQLPLSEPAANSNDSFETTRLPLPDSGENITSPINLDNVTAAATTLEPTTMTAVTSIISNITTKLTSSTQRMDINAIMAIISNLTYDYEWNLTEQFNKTIIEHGVPTCPWEKWGPGGAWTTVVVNTTTLFPWNFENASVVSKCFVCGLRTPEIPRSAFCADAFAGDFLPLMPIDAQSRGKIAGFRKYCRYMDTQNYLENPDEPRAIYGRFTGGCAVRWTDLTGVYTQRTCRSRFRPLMGKHFASKRMAKLELALVNVENGCIISPMATLLPVSRGISLYARFHACVCSTNWCNRATLEQASFNTLATIVLAYWLVHYP